jgi:hypothetical protein
MGGDSGAHRRVEHVGEDFCDIAAEGADRVLVDIAGFVIESPGVRVGEQRERLGHEDKGLGIAAAIGMHRLHGVAVGGFDHRRRRGARDVERLVGIEAGHRRLIAATAD